MGFRALLFGRSPPPGNTGSFYRVLSLRIVVTRWSFGCDAHHSSEKNKDDGESLAQAQAISSRRYNRRKLRTASARMRNRSVLTYERGAYINRGCGESVR
jgi:hypothetical protein